MTRAGRLLHALLAKALLVKALLALLGLLALPAAASEDPRAPCVRERFEEARFTICTIDLAAHALRLFAADEAGAPYGRFSRLPETLDGAPLVFAMNAGMFDEALAPIGLHVEAGETIRPLVTGDGPGNFQLLPNGVFYVDDGRAGVMETRAFARARIAPELATQSGPMLVIDGRLHPRFIEGSTSLKRRNGVGIAPDGRILFAIAEEPVTFHHFARLFRDRLGVANALFLDGGSVPSLHAPHLGRSDGWRPLGPILAAYARE